MQSIFNYYPNYYPLFVPMQYNKRFQESSTLIQTMNDLQTSDLYRINNEDLFLHYTVCIPSSLASSTRLPAVSDIHKYAVQVWAYQEQQILDFYFIFHRKEYGDRKQRTKFSF